MFCALTLNIGKYHWLFPARWTDHPGPPLICPAAWKIFIACWCLCLSQTFSRMTIPSSQQVVLPVVAEEEVVVVVVVKVVVVVVVVVAVVVEVVVVVVVVVVMVVVVV